MFFISSSSFVVLILTIPLSLFLIDRFILLASLTFIVIDFYSSVNATFIFPPFKLIFASLSNLLYWLLHFQSTHSVISYNFGAYVPQVSLPTDLKMPTKFFQRRVLIILPSWSIRSSQLSPSLLMNRNDRAADWLN